jgi:hypothetical protein
MKDSDAEGMTRRQLAAAVLASAPIQAQPPASPADEVTAARQQRQQSADQLRKTKVPMATEPSFVFRP